MNVDAGLSIATFVAGLTVLLLMFRLDWCCKNHDKIQDAIASYNVFQIMEGHRERVIDHRGAVEPFEKTCLRWWDWSCK